MLACGNSSLNLIPMGYATETTFARNDFGTSACNLASKQSSKRPRSGYNSTRVAAKASFKASKRICLEE